MHWHCVCFYRIEGRKKKKIIQFAVFLSKKMLLWRRIKNNFCLNNAKCFFFDVSYAIRWVFLLKKETAKENYRKERALKKNDKRNE